MSKPKKNDHWVRVVLIIVGSLLLLALLGYFVQSRLFKPSIPTVTPPVITIPSPTETTPIPTSKSPTVTGVTPPQEFTVIPGTSIQAVLNRMPSGSICNIQPGIYQESLVIPRSGLTLRKIGSGDVIIDGSGADNAVLIENVERTTLTDLIIQNAQGSLILITGSKAAHNTINHCTLLEWGLDEVTTYVGAVDSADGAAYTTVDSCYLYRGDHKSIWEQNVEAIGYHFSGGHHTITNNVIWGVCRDSQGIPIQLQSDFGDGFPLYKFNIQDATAGEDGKNRIDFDGTVISGNYFYGAHDDMIGVQGLDRNCTISNNYIDAMGGADCIVIRGASIGPVYIQDNICVNSGMNCFKYASWDLGSGNAVKYISSNTYYSTLSRTYVDDGSGNWYVTGLSDSYSRFIDGEVNGPDYDYLFVDRNAVFCKTYFLCLMPGSGTHNTFTNNRFSTDDPKSCVKWFSHDSTIDFENFNSYTGGTNVWETISRPRIPPSPSAGARP